MMEQMLVAHDGSDRARKAFDFAVDLAARLGARLRMICVEEEIPRHAEVIDELLEEKTSGERLTTVLLSSFAAAGLGLAVVGIYGVVSFLVAQRKQELAVRIALGASRTNVLWLVLKQSLEMATIGAMIGLVGAWAAQKLTSGLLFGVSAVDPLTFASGAVFLLTVAALASAVPGARVMWIDPAQTLRQD